MATVSQASRTSIRETRQILMEAAAVRTVADWGRPANESRSRERDLIWKLIQVGNEDVLAALAEYLDATVPLSAGD